MKKESEKEIMLTTRVPETLFIEMHNICLKLGVSKKSFLIQAVAFLVDRVKRSPDYHTVMQKFDLEERN